MDQPSTSQPRPGIALSKGGHAKEEEEETEISMREKLATIVRLGKRYLLGHSLVVLFYIALIFLAQTLLPQQIALYLGTLTNHFQSEVAIGGDSSLVTTYWFWLLLSVALVGLSFGSKYLGALLDSNISNALRVDVFASILKQSPDFFLENPSDRLTMIVTQFCTLVANAIRRLLIDPVLQLVGVGVIGWTIFARISTMVTAQAEQAAARNEAVWTILGVNAIWFLFSIILVFALCSPSIVMLMGSRLQRNVAAVQQQNLAHATLIGGAFKAPEEIQSMRAENILETKFKAALKKSQKLQLTQSMTIERLNALSDLPGTVVLAAFLGLAIYLENSAQSGQPGMIVQVALLTPMLMAGIHNISNFSLATSMAWPSIEMIASLLSRKAAVEDLPGAKDFETIAPTLESRGVVFSYRPGETPAVLNLFSFQPPPGKITGFIARKGQGKSTFFRLALRFYEPQEGEILLGGIPIRQFTLQSLRRHIVLMHQFPAFFHDTVRENLVMAVPGATDSTIQKVLETTGVWEVLRKLPGDNPLDAAFSAGAILSGGEKKLFALSRCLLRDPSVLLLDEPTTGLDASEKFRLLTQMRSTLTSKTVLVIDHDIVWQTRFCDHFVVLDQGRIIQEGPPSEVIQSGLGKELFDHYQALPAHKPAMVADAPVRPGPQRDF